MKQQAIKAQRGITLIGFIMVLAVAGFFIFLAMRLVPVYVEYYSVVKNVKAICKEPDAPKASIDEMRKKLALRFVIDYVENFDPRKNMKMVREGETKTLNIVYEVRKPLIYNLDFVAKFEHSEPMVGGGAASE
jgi:Domain of unknown function (DUF4845)